jgi:hypothetical protein
MGSPETYHCLEGCVFDSVKSQGQPVFQWLLLQVGQGTRG